MKLVGKFVSIIVIIYQNTLRIGRSLPYILTLRLLDLSSIFRK